MLQIGETKRIIFQVCSRLGAADVLDESELSLTEQRQRGAQHKTLAGIPSLCHWHRHQLQHSISVIHFGV